MAILWLHPAWLLQSADIPPLFQILPAALLLLAACYLLIPTVAVSAAELCGSRDEDLSSKTRLNNRTNNQQTSHPLQPSSLTTGTNQNGFDGNHIISSPAHANMCKKMFWHGMYFLTGKNSSCSNERFFFPIAALCIFQASHACRRNRT